MPARQFEIRYPDGDYEVNSTSLTFPAVGQTLVRKGVVWRVTRTQGSDPVFVYVEPAHDRQPADAGRSTARE